MSKNDLGRVIGIFLQDRQAIVASVPNEEMWFSTLKKAKYYHRIPITKKTKCLKDIVAEALSWALNQHSTFSIRAVCIGSPGPILKSGRGQNVEKSDDYGLIKSFYERRAIFSNANLKFIFEDIKKELNHSGLNKAEFVVIHDAAAIGLGSFRAREENPISDSDNNIPSELERLQNGLYYGWSEAHITVNEGVGGVIVNRRGLLEGGAMHSEMGHISVKRHEVDYGRDLPKCEGNHNDLDCLERMVSIAALKDRWGKDALKKLGTWTTSNIEIEVISYYLAQLCAQLTLIIAPNRIVFSGYPSKNQLLIKYIGVFLQEMLRIDRDENEFYPGYSAQKDMARFITSEATEKTELFGIYGCCHHVKNRGDNISEIGTQ